MIECGVLMMLRVIATSVGRWLQGLRLLLWSGWAMR